MILSKNVIPRIFILFSFFIFSINLIAQTDSIDIQDQYQKGAELFKSKCNSCHNFPGGGKLVGPDLKDVLEHNRFVNEEDPASAFIRYVKNPADFGVTDMAAEILTDEDEIKSVLVYINNYSPEKGEQAKAEEDLNERMSPIVILIIVIIALFVLILVLTSIKNKLKKHQGIPTETVFESITNFCKAYWANKRAVLLTSFILFIVLLKIGFDLMTDIGVVEGYQPKQPIEFSHKIHAGDNKIDCNYCHSSARSSKTAGVPSVNVCMNCHASIKGSTDEAKSEIGKIWKSFGLDIHNEKHSFEWDSIDIYDKQPIEWVRVHQLPDLTYFNHSQHVTVGGLECQQCHGAMEEKTVGQVAYHDELNKIQKNIEEGIEFKNPTLTMGWCIDCHKQKEIDMGSNEYYIDMHKKIKNDARYKNKKITPALIGGLECGKCHY